VSDATAESRVVESLANAVGAERFAFTPNERGYRALLERTISAGAVIVLYSDVIASGESLRLIALELRRAGLHPTLIATLVDGRPNARADPMELSLSVPLIALAQTELVAPDDEPEYFIDPLTREVERAETTPDSSEAYFLTEGRISEVVRQRNALHFTHAGEPEGRHFTFYMDAKELLDEPLIKTAVVDAVARWLAAHMIDTRDVEIWHPAPEPKRAQPARRLAEYVRDGIGNQNAMPPIVAIRRQRRGISWTFPLTYTRRTRPVVVIVDWGALSGASTSQMIRLAATAGASRVLACTFLSQLAVDEEAFLTGLSAIKGYERDTPALFERPEAVITGKGVSVDVVFAGRFSIGAYSSAECPVCERIDELRELKVPIAWLMEHRSEILRRLRQRTRDEVVSGRPTDYFDTPLDPELIEEMINRRLEIVKTQTSTRSLYQLAATLQSMATEGAIKRAAVVTLLGNEIHWLARPPLNLLPCANAVAEIAASVAADRAMPTLARWSAASIITHLPLTPVIRRLADICEVNAASVVVLAETFLAIWAILTRTPPLTAEQARGLSASLADGARLLDTSAAVPAARAACASLRARVDATITETALEETDERRVWSQLDHVLKEDAREHHPVSYKMSHVYMLHERQRLEAAARAIRNGNTSREAADRHLDDRILRKIARAHDNWIGCAEFFDREVTPRLRKLLATLEGVECRRVLGPYAARLLAFCDNRQLLLDDRFSHLLYEAASEPLVLIAPDNWEYFRTTSEWVFEGLLKRLDAVRIAPLRRLISSLPADIAASFNNAFAELENDGRAPEVVPAARARIDAVHANAFCPDDLLRESFHQVLINVLKHSDESTGRTPYVDITIDDMADHIIIHVDSYLTAEKPPAERGTGLTGLRTRLQSFGCDLLPEAHAGGVSFRVRLALRKAVIDG